jgi:hypothetical protein
MSHQPPTPAKRLRPPDQDHAAQDYALLDTRWTTFADVEGSEFNLIDANVRGR